MVIRHCDQFGDFLLNLRHIDIHVAFNYGQATGSAQLLRFVTEHTEVVLDFPSGID